jgi:hypothetical protein
MKLRSKTAIIAAVVLFLAVFVMTYAYTPNINVRKDGSEWGRIQPDGTIRILGNMVGSFDNNGYVRKNGVFAGRIEGNGTIRKNGNYYGSLETNGNIRVGGVYAGRIEQGGAIRNKSGTTWGSAENINGYEDMKKVAALLVFFTEDF